MLKVILVDDESLCLDVLQTLIVDYLPAIKILGRYQNAEEAIPAILFGKPDIIFLDIEMPLVNGFELLDRLKPYNFNVIFTTAHDDFAVKAYKYDVKNYLLKPITLSDLKEAIHRIVTIHSNTKTNQSLVRFSFSTHEGTHIVSTDEILYCEADDSYCIIHLVNKKKIIVSKTLKEIESLLLPHHFYRQHHSFMININHLVRYFKSDGGHVILKGDVELPVSRSKKEEFLRIIDELI